MQPSDHMRYLYQKDKRALPGNLQNRRYSFLPSHPKYSVSRYHPLSLSLNQVSSVREPEKRRLGGWCKMVAILRVSRNRGSWKGATIQRGSEHWSTGIAIVRNHYQATTIEAILHRTPSLLFTGWLSTNGVPSCLQDNSSSRTTQKTAPFSLL
jgi:hypothetical protein